MNLKEGIDKISSVEYNIEKYPSFDEFMEWLDIPAPLDCYLSAESKFRAAGYEVRADLVRRKYEQLKNNS